MNGNYRNPNNPTADGAVHTFGMGGYPTVSVQIDGTISAGAFQAQVSDDGQTWYNISTVKLDGTLASTINASGLYRADVNGFEVFRLLASDDFSGVCSVISIASPMALLTTLVDGIPVADIAPEWVAGTYAANDIVFHDSVFWVSNIASNTSTPGVANWTQYDTVAEILTYILNLF